MVMTRATADTFTREAERAAPVPEAAPRRTARLGTEVPWYLDLREVLHVLRLRKTLVALPVAGFLALGGGAALLLTPQYTASTVLLIDPQGLMVVKDDLTPPGQASDASLILVDSQMQVLSSDDVLRRVVARFDLADDPDFVGRPSLVGRFLSGVAYVVGAGGGRASDPNLVALRSLRERLGVRRLERSFALTVSLTAGDPQRAADIAQGVVDTYLAYDGQVRGELASRAGGAITARLGQLQADVREAEDKAQAFRTAENLVGTRTQLLSEQQLNQLSEQLGVAR
ncbi:MAG: hypothetical protein INR63_31735, partial [Actinomycetospora chiangmaiensis]|nr:hypothetical protein [Actinomycetospora chiangmaiensis]